MVAGWTFEIIGQYSLIDLLSYLQIEYILGNFFNDNQRKNN